MKNVRYIINLLFLFITYNSFASNIVYNIYHHPQQLHITLEFNGNTSGVTHISIPSNIWGHDLDKQIKNLKILDNSIKQEDSNILLHKSNQIII